MSGRVVVEGAIIKCSCGAIPTPLLLSLGRNLQFSGKSACIITDCIPGVNIQPFGVCSLTKSPCSPVTPAPWTNDIHVELGAVSQPLLTETSTLQCGVGGTIKILVPGQEVGIIELLSKMIFPLVVFSPVLAAIVALEKALEKQESQVPGLSSNEAKKAIQQALQDQRTMLESKKAELERWDNIAKDNFNKWFGTTDEQDRKLIQDRIDRMLELNEKYSLDNFQAASPSERDRFAYVYPNKPDTIYLDMGFANAPATGINSRAGTLSHEMSHFYIIGGTKDHVYGTESSLELARENSQDALYNADNFEYYIEDQFSPL